jgi:hypothetical protein
VAGEFHDMDPVPSSPDVLEGGGLRTQKESLRLPCSSSFPLSSHSLFQVAGEAMTQEK